MGNMRTGTGEESSATVVPWLRSKMVRYSKIFAVAVVAIEFDHLGDLAAVGIALQLDDELHRFTDLRGDVIPVCLLVGTHGKLAEFAQSTLCCGRMDGGHRPSP